MPIYDLLCEKCNTKVELIIKTEEKVKCRKCGRIMKKLPTQAHFVLKGDCWATDSYSRKEK